MKVLLKKEVCGSCKQCMGVGFVHIARDPPIDTFPREMRFSIKKKKRKENAARP